MTEPFTMRIVTDVDVDDDTVVAALQHMLHEANGRAVGSPTIQRQQGEIVVTIDAVRLP